MLIEHVERDYNKPLEQQKKELEREYKDLTYLFSDGQKIHFATSGKKEVESNGDN